ncbi:MAG: branched-chain amino acid ABC transporter permease [Actinomycetota bacterium]|nr:branched-chain amino acid ABC transporter permease [Actinomycetota bacterium]
MSAVTEVSTLEVPATATAEAPPATLPLPGPLGGRVVTARLAGVAVLAALLLVLPDALSWAGPAYAIDFGLIIALAVLSISVLGWIGEISLATLAQMGMGVVVLNRLQEAGIPFAVIVPIVIVASIPVSLVLGVFALRLRGVYFAIATLAFAFLAQKTVFQTYLGTEGGFEKPLARPSYLTSDQQVYYLLLVSLLVIAGLCYLILRSWIGTRLTALRDSETAFAVLGHSPARYKLFTICFAGAIATLTGTYYGILQQVVPANYFSPALSITYFAYAVVGGLGSIAGAIASGVVFGAVPKYLETLSEGRFVGYDQFFAGAVALVVILTLPGGLTELGRRIWRRVEGVNR